MKTILVLGASSGIAQAYIKQELNEGSRMVLAARSVAKLTPLLDWARQEKFGENLKVLPFQAEASDPVQLLDEAEKFLGQVDIVLIAFGTYRDQRRTQAIATEALSEIQDNFVSLVPWLTELAARFESRRRGTIAVISSVAGDRGRQSNYVYGAAKAGLNAYLEGLRHRLRPAGVMVVTIKPGFVDTPMTAKLPKNFLFASPELVARDIRHAIRRGCSEVYSPFFWSLILLIVKNLPRAIFYRTRL
jgi:decaprenylphospho-beta-D-erythro-pentofuranosid-2-ulose 2-reductase